MKSAKILHWGALAALAYVALSSILAEHNLATFQVVFATTLWSFLWWMLFRRPQSWGLGIGIFLLVVIAIQLGLWRLALTRKEEYQVNDSWLHFARSGVPHFVAAACSISLRWMVPAPAPIAASGRAPS